MRSIIAVLLISPWVCACTEPPAPDGLAEDDPTPARAPDGDEADGAESSSADNSSAASTSDEADPDRPPVVAGAPLYPETRVRLVEGDPGDARRMADVEVCADCHADVAEAWRASPHAAASFDNPWYRQAVDSFRDDRGPEASRFCAGCHDPVLLVDDAMDEPIEPSDPRAHAGITCMVCHGIQEARADGVGSYTLRTAEVPLPDPVDAAEVAAHVAALTPEPLRSAQLCGTCHRGFLGPDMGNPHHLAGTDDLGGWRRSGYAGSRASRVDAPLTEETCQGCHMPSVDGTERDYATTEGQIHSHRIPGGHTALAAARGDDEQLAFVRERLLGVARIDVMPSTGEASSTEPGRVELDVVIRNLSVGHRFPGGIRDAQDTWVELEVRDADGQLVAEAGTRHATSVDETAHRLVAVVVDDDAEVRELHRVQHFRASLFDRTIGPREAVVVRYAFSLGEDVRRPVSVEARLRHRRHTHAMQEAACASDRSRRGRAFRAAAEALGRTPIDACRPQPITEIDSARVRLGEDGVGQGDREGGAAAPDFTRYFDHALALIGDVQERLDRARPSLEAALRAAPDDLSRAMVYAQRARLEGRQGRLREALADATRAQRLIGRHPAIDRLRGDAYAQVWRWQDAANAYRASAERAPLDVTGWADLARALGSAGQDDAALEATSRGLALSPRHGALLRTRFLALDRASDAAATEAQEAFLAHRTPDEGFELTLRCAENSSWCARERLPVHTHDLRAH